MLNSTRFEDFLVEAFFSDFQGGYLSSSYEEERAEISKDRQNLIISSNEEDESHAKSNSNNSQDIYAFSDKIMNGDDKTEKKSNTNSCKEVESVEYHDVSQTR